MQEFDKMWTHRLSTSLSENFGSAYRTSILNTIKDIDDPIEKTQILLDTFENQMPEDKIHDVLTNTTCRFPHSELVELSKLYKETEDLSLIHTLLQKMFEKNIVTYKSLTKNELEYVIEHNWGIAGKLIGNTIYVTKLPSQFHKYFKTINKNEKNSYYCHCPRIREAIKKGLHIPYKYCYCGGGYYRDIWKTITRKEVRVEIVKSILKGNNVCEFKINILQ